MCLFTWAHNVSQALSSSNIYISEDILNKCHMTGVRLPQEIEEDRRAIGSQNFIAQ